MKKLFVIIMTAMVGITLMAGPRDHNRHGRHHDHHHHHNNGVRLAADIVGLVGAGLNILRPANTVVVQQPAVVAPVAPTVVYPAPPPVYQRPVYVQPIPRPIVSPVYDERYVFPTYPQTYKTVYYDTTPRPRYIQRYRDGYRYYY